MKLKDVVVTGQVKVGKDELIGEESPLVEAKGSDWKDVIRNVRNDGK